MVLCHIINAKCAVAVFRSALVLIPFLAFFVDLRAYFKLFVTGTQVFWGGRM